MARPRSARSSEEGNTGGPAVLRILARTHDDPPAEGAEGLLFGVGPGLLRGRSTNALDRTRLSRCPDQRAAAP
ncbi:hypothetical protein [Streptomyces sp. NBC_00887]|uniref:hypothetical protein n=1 Tax=Streptomyces sp. NBC_00887 TaxID=2975859 RepID=UPI00386CD1A9|nr:hypothetical protein OG844_11035 [Streptomyces sp. NBC_00887]